MTENTTYLELVDRFFDKIKDYDLAEMDEETSYKIVVGYIPSACNDFQSCQQPLEDRDDEIQEFNFKLTPSNKEILVNYMVIEWLDSNFINTTAALKPRMTTADFHAIRLDYMLEQALEVRQALKEENDQLAINKSYLDSDIFDVVKNRRRPFRRGM